MAILKESIAAVQDGSAYKPPPSVDGLTGIGLESATTAAEAITQTWSTATSNLSKTLSVTSSQVKVIELEAKSEGRQPTEEELDEACGPLSFLVSVPKALNEALGDIYGKVDEFATSFGQTIGEFASDLNQLIDDVANAIDETAEELAQEALELFETANSLAISALNTVENAINSAVGFVNDAIVEAERLLDAAVEKLLGFARSLNFASLFSLDCQKEAVENGVDSEKVADAAEVERVVAPTVVNDSDNEIASETLSTPQTTFAPAVEPRTIPPGDLELLTQRYLDAAALADELSREVFDPAFTSRPAAEIEEVNRRYEAAQDARDQAQAEMISIAQRSGVPVESLPVYKSSYKNFSEPATPQQVDEVEIRGIVTNINFSISGFSEAQTRAISVIQRIEDSGRGSTPAAQEFIQSRSSALREQREEIINEINSLPPDIAGRVKAALDPVPPLQL